MTKEKMTDISGAFIELQKRLFTGNPHDCYLAGQLAFAEEIYNTPFKDDTAKMYKKLMQEIQDLINKIANEIYNNVKSSINFTGAKEK